MSAPAASHAPARPGAAYWRHLPGLVLGGAFLVLLASSVDMRQVAAILARASWPPLILALLAYAADFVLRALRFWLLLRARRPAGLPFAPTLAPFIASFGISDVLPLRLGDVFRVWWFRRRHALPVADVLGAMIVERVLDLVAILAVAGFALWLADAALPGVALERLTFAFAAAAAISAGLLFAPALLARGARLAAARLHVPVVQTLAAQAGALADAVRRIGDARRMGWMLLLSVGLWLLESVVMLGAWASLGGAPGALSAPLLAFATSTLGTLVPALPGHFGSYEVFGVLAYTAMGIAPEWATATILLSHLLLWLPTALFGVVWLLVVRPGRFTGAHATA